MLGSTLYWLQHAERLSPVAIPTVTVPGLHTPTVTVVLLRQPRDQYVSRCCVGSRVARAPAVGVLMPGNQKYPA